MKRLILILSCVLMLCACGTTNNNAANDATKPNNGAMTNGENNVVDDMDDLGNSIENSVEDLMPGNNNNNNNNNNGNNNTTGDTTRTIMR